MERAAEFNLDLAISHYLDALNLPAMLSHAERDEIYDHLYSEIEELEKIGLSTEEAFIISQKRFGNPGLIQSEFRKAKPFAQFAQFFILAIVSILGIKIVFNLVSIISLSIPMVLSSVSLLDIPSYLQWGDLAVQGLSLVVVLGIAALLAKRLLEGHTRNLWLVPLAFVCTEIGQMLLTSFSISFGLDQYMLGAIKLNAHYVYWGFALLGVLISSWILFKNRHGKLGLYPA